MKPNWILALASTLLFSACGGDDSPPADADADTDGDTDGDSDADGDTDGDTDADCSTEGCTPVECGGFVWSCGNCEDDDADGVADWCDSDCVGPCDNTEVGYDLGISGGGEAPCQLDCYYDHDTGSGNDTCVWNHFCDPLYPPWPEETCPPVPDGERPMECPDVQAQTCHDLCSPLTPNGCDCFGCCETEPDSGRFVFLGSVDYDTGEPSCNSQVLGDDDLCHPCTPVGDCYNDCGECELCFGRDTLPPGCDPDEGEARCPDPDDGAPCGLEGDEPCPVGVSCISGCCEEIII